MTEINTVTVTLTTSVDINSNTETTINQRIQTNQLQTYDKRTSLSQVSTWMMP